MTDLVGWQVVFVFGDNVDAMRLDPCQAGHQSPLLNTRSNADGTSTKALAFCLTLGAALLGSASDAQVTVDSRPE
jgi:hypothetical protein